MQLKSLRTVQKLAHRKQVEELTASRSSSDVSSPDETYSDDPLLTPKAAIPVLLVPDTPDPNESEESTTQPDLTVAPVDLKGRARLLSDVVMERDQGSRSSSRRSRSPSPTPIRVPPNYRTDISLHQSPEQFRPHKGRHEEQDDSRLEVEEGMYLKSKLWWLGMVLIAVGEGGNFLSYAFAPASVVAPLGTVVSLIGQSICRPGAILA